MASLMPAMGLARMGLLYREAYKREREKREYRRLQEADEDLEQKERQRGEERKK